MTSRLERAINANRRDILAKDAAVQRDLLRVYLDAEKRLRLLIELAQAEINALPAGDVTAWQVFELGRWQQLERELLLEIGNTARWGESLTLSGQADLIAMAGDHTTNSALAQVPRSGQSAFLQDWQQLPESAIQDVLGLTRNGPLSALFESIAPAATEQARQAIIDGLALGNHPRLVADALQNALGTSQTRAMTIARTEMLRAYRDANLLTYAENADILDGWVWTAALDDTTCEVCLAEDGTVYPLSVMFFPSHPNCRCSPSPAVSGEPWGRETGEEWFARQDAATQEGILGPGKFSAYEAGEIALKDMIRVTQSDVWGEGRAVASLGQARANATRR